MERRKFLKASVFGLGGLALLSVSGCARVPTSASEIDTSQKKGENDSNWVARVGWNTALESKGTELNAYLLELGLKHEQFHRLLKLDSIPEEARFGFGISEKGYFQPKTLGDKEYLGLAWEDIDKRPRYLLVPSTIVSALPDIEPVVYPDYPEVKFKLDLAQFITYKSQRYYPKSDKFEIQRHPSANDYLSKPDALTSVIIRYNPSQSFK